MAPLQKMLAPRRALVLAVVVLCLFLFLRRSTSSNASPKPNLEIKLDSTKASRQRGPSHLASTNPKHLYPTSSSSYKVLHAAELQQKPLLADYTSTPLRQRLAYEFPYNPEERFPNYIWQTWKYNPSSSKFFKDFRPLEASWSYMHPGFIHEVITDDAAVYMLRHLYSAFPDVVEAYTSLPRAVLKADFFRYLILLARGGIYSDIDTAAIRSAVDWVPQEVSRESYGLVIGIEADPDRDDWADWYSRRIQFCQWTIQAKSGHPVLREIVANITEKTLELKDKGALRQLDVHGVIEFTGPAVWTDIIFDFFNDPEYFDLTTGHGEITWKQFTGMKRAKKVGDVVVLPITCFSPGIRTMGAGEDDDPMAFVKHLFEGIWKPENERHIGEEGHD